jgi:hypothetical protein
MTLILEKYFVGKISLVNHHIMGKENKGNKGNTPLFSLTTQPKPKNNFLKKITPYPPNTTR